jgi:hypothetical protein
MKKAKRSILLLTVLLIAAMGSANVFTNPPFTVDDLLVLEGQQLAKNAQLQNTQFSQQKQAFVLADNATSGNAYLGPLSTKFPFNEALPSWNGWAPPDGGWIVWMRVGNDNGWTPWFEAGSWGAVSDDATTRVAQFPQGIYDTDSLLLKDPMQYVEFRIELQRKDPASPSPEVRLVALSYSNTLGDRALWERYARTRTPQSPKLDARKTTFTLPMEFRSQVVPNPQWIGRICAPASLAMAASAFGVKLPTEQFAGEVYDPVSDLFGVWHRMVQGGAQHGLRGYITRIRSWEVLRQEVEKGHAVCASIRFRFGEIPHPPRIYAKRGTQGHLVAIVGLGPKGTILVHDSASKDWGRFNEWTQEQLQKAWFDKGGVAIVFTGKAR